MIVTYLSGAGDPRRLFEELRGEGLGRPSRLDVLAKPPIPGNLPSPFDGEGARVKPLP